MSQVIEFESSTGSTLASKLFASGSDTVVATASAVTEATNRKGVFNATFSGVTLGTYRILSTESSVPDSAWWVDITAADGVFIAYELSKPASQPIIPNGIVQRSVSDTNPLTFAWPVSGATITGEASINNGAYTAVSGIIDFLRTEDTKHYYTLAYNVSDRPTANGNVRYKFIDGIYTRYVVLQTETSVLDAVTPSGFRDIFETYQMTESYASVGVEPTPAQAMYMHQAFTDFAISGVIISVKGLSGAEVAQYTINSSTSPTQRLRTL